MNKAMAEREDALEVSLSGRNEEDLSPECLAWADSCINSFPDDSDNNSWGTFRDALTEIIHIHPGIFVPSSTSPDEDMIETASSDKQEADSTKCNKYSSTEEISDIVSLLTFETDPFKNSLRDHYFPESVAENSPTTDLGGAETIEEDCSVSNGEAEEEPKSVSSQVFKDDFMSIYKQHNVDDPNDSEDLVKVTPQEIFKVWDLEIVGDDDVEDGLMLQLKKALDEPSTAQPLNDGQVVAEKSSIDDLIAGISDLSLAETFK